MLDKLGGAFVPKPSSGPHKSRECFPLILILRNPLKYALTYREIIAILMQRHVLVDAKVRTVKHILQVSWIRRCSPNVVDLGVGRRQLRVWVRSHWVLSR